MFRFFHLQFTIRWKQLRKQMEQLHMFNHGDERDAATGAVMIGAVR